MLLTEEEISQIDKSQSILLSEVTYVVETSENGEVVAIYNSDDPALFDSSGTSTGHKFSATYSFYEVQGVYYVTMDASVNDSTWWFAKHQMQIRPKNNTGWYTHKNSYAPDRPTDISDEMYFNYPNGVPSNVTVEVKGYFDVMGDGPFELEQFRTTTHKLDNP